MTDQELLEMAMKAAKIKPPAYMQGWFYSKIGPYGEGMYAGSDRCNHAIWNPLSNDGDALRLAVQLNLWPYASSEDGVSGRIGVWCQDEDGKMRDTYGVDSWWGDIAPVFNPVPTKQEATRRAIVMAAVEMRKEIS